MKHTIAGKRLEISGVVQGVGFRPFIFQLAQAYDFTGEVFNTAQGVTLIVEGRKDKMERFLAAIKEKKPPLAILSAVTTTDLSLSHYKNFIISGSSENESKRSALISPDVTVCRDCILEMEDPKDRRFRYPFINCTNCGPRYTIIKDIPYDRPKTSMGVFTMCPLCQAEYYDPLNRRFHAQPNACPECGPHTFLVDNTGKTVTLEDDPVTAAGRLLKQGAVMAVKGLGGFHLAADATCEKAVKTLRTRKNRPHKPFAIMARSIDAAAGYVHISPEERELLESIHRPIVLLEKKEAPDPGMPSLSGKLAPMNRYLGIMLPYTPLHYLLLETGPKLLVMTSGNPSGEPLSIENSHALKAFGHIADYFLLHDRDIYFRADDSIMQCQGQKPRFLRRSRGYAPLPLFLKKELPTILACGAGLKSTVCLTKKDRVFLSQHIGTLDNLEVFSFFKESIKHLKRILDIEPVILAHDLHPDYMSTLYAREQTGIAKVAVQHHHAHAVSCMAENGLNEEVIAVILDGTGFGEDGRIWGGEVLTCTEEKFSRRAHLAYMPMPGGDKAVMEPWRMGTAYLYKALGASGLDAGTSFAERIGKNKLEFLIQMMDKKINSPMTSSCGRLFDAVAAILGIRDVISFESQAAMELEALSGRMPENGYDFIITKAAEANMDPIHLIDPLPVISQIMDAVEQKESLSVISAMFHKTVIQMFVKAAVMVSRDTGIVKAVLSGGVFNNRLIFHGITRGLEKNGISVYTHTKVPCGDGGISLGQAVAAGAIKREL